MHLVQNVQNSPILTNLSTYNIIIIHGVIQNWPIFNTTKIPKLNT